MKYLIIKCEPLNDQYECDANRTPVCMTDDPTQYGYGYEVWKVCADGSFKLVKKYNTVNERGLALYKWEGDADPETDPPVVIAKYPGMTQHDLTNGFVRDIIRMAGFEYAPYLMREVQSTGSYGEELGADWVVFGEYRDNCFECGY